MSVSAYRDELTRICRQESIRRIAEEMSAEGLARHGVTMTVGAQVAAALGIEHRNVDLTAAERNMLSIDDGPVLAIVQRFHPSDGGAGFREAMDDLGHAVRERVWVARLLTESKAVWPTLFVCGSDHVESVRRIIRAVGMDSIVLHRDYEA